MKLTREDLEIWVGQVMVLRSEFGNSWALCMYQDRRDAELMFRAQSNRYAAVPPDWPDAVYVEDPPMLRPMVYACGPVGGDITKYICTLD